MESTSNQISLDFSENPDLQAALGGHQPGDRVKLEVTIMVTAIDDQKFEGTIEGITTDSEDGEKETADVSADEPVMVVMSKKGSKVKPEPESSATDEGVDESTPDAKGYSAK